MRALLVASLVCCTLVLAGCSDGGGNGSGATTTTTTATFQTTTGALATSQGLPVVTVSDEMDIGLSLGADGKVQRVRLVAFKDFTLDEANKPGSEGGGGGGGGGGGNAPVKDFGLALFPADTSPAQQASCTDAGEFPAWDGRTDATNPDWSVKAGLYDLWAWSTSSTTLVLGIDGGGPATNITMRAHNWTVEVKDIGVTKSGPAQTTASFDEPVQSTLAALVFGEFSPPQGYPDRTADLAVALDGTECVKASVSGNGGGFGGTALRVHAFVGNGQASLAGNFASTLTPVGEPSAMLVVLKPQ